MSIQTESLQGHEELPEHAVARRVREQLGGQNVTMLALSKATGIARTTLTRSVKTEEYPLDVRAIRLIATALGVTYEWLATGGGQKYVDPNGAPSRTRTYDLRIKSSVDQPMLTLAA